MASHFSLDEATRLLQLGQDYIDETNEAKKAERRNRMTCAFKRTIRYTESTKDLGRIYLLMRKIDPNYALDRPPSFPASLWKHLKNKLVYQWHVENKAQTAKDRRRRKAMRRQMAQEVAQQ